MITNIINIHFINVTCLQILYCFFLPSEHPLQCTRTFQFSLNPVKQLPIPRYHNELLKIYLTFSNAEAKS